GQTDDPVALLFQKSVQGRERRITDRLVLAGWLEHREQGGKQSDRGRKGDDDPGAGDQPELGKSHISGRQKRIEGGRDRRCGEQKRSRDAPAGRYEGLLEIAARMPLRSIADAELDTEIDAETNEEYAEGDRDRVERSDHPQPDSGGENQPDHEIRENSRDDTCLLQREPQY